MLRRLAAAALVAFATVPPLNAAIITYDVSISDGNYITSSSTYDYLPGVSTNLGEIAPAISPLTLTGRFVVNSTQGTKSFPFPSFPFQSNSGTFINSTITGDQPLASLSTSLTGANVAELTTYEYVGGFFSLDVNDFAQTLFYDQDGNVSRVINELFRHTLTIANVSEFTYLDGKAFPKLNGPGITAMLTSGHTIYDYDYSGGGILLTNYQWEARAIGRLGDTATATDHSPTDVPEPASLALLGLGLAGMAVRRRWRVAA